MLRVRAAIVAGLMPVVVLAACSSGGGSTASPATTAPVQPSSAPGSPAPAVAGMPQPAHVVVVVMENHSYSGVIGNSAAPFINGLAAQGASFSHSRGVTHPSEPNYLALFSGTTQGVTDDSCPHTFTGANLATELVAGGRTFAGYSEGLPSTGFQGCVSGDYARKHNPWVNFPAVPASANLSFDRFPSDYSTLPTVSFVVPNLCNDMHNCPVATGDTWLRTHLGGYVSWAKAHDSLLVLTWDEDDNSNDNQIPTVIAGAGVKAGVDTQSVNHYTVLRTIEDMYGLPHVGESAGEVPITGIWG